MTTKTLEPEQASKNLRTQQELRLYKALAGSEPGSQEYTTILSQITALTAHDRAVNLKLLEYQQKHIEHHDARDLEDLKATHTLELEREKQTAARNLKIVDICGKIGAISLVLFFEMRGHAVISKSFGFVKD